MPYSGGGRVPYVSLASTSVPGRTVEVTNLMLDLALPDDDAETAAVVIDDWCKDIDRHLELLYTKDGQKRLQAWWESHCDFGHPFMSEHEFVPLVGELALLESAVAIELFTLLDHSMSGTVRFVHVFLVIALTLSAASKRLVAFWYRHRAALVMMMQSAPWGSRYMLLGQLVGIDEQRIDDAMDEVAPASAKLSRRLTDAQVELLYFLLFSELDEQRSPSTQSFPHESAVCCSCAIA